MKANIISLTSLPGGMKDVQFQLKDCCFSVFLCSEQCPCTRMCCLGSLQGKALVCARPWLEQSKDGDPVCQGCWAGGRCSGGWAVQSRSCRAPVEIALSFLCQ